MSDALVDALIDACAKTIEEHVDELSDLDRAIGDGDHGHNMRRGYDAIVAERDAIAALELPQALQKAGMTLVMKVGGASGPLYGSLLMSMGKSGGDLAAMFEAGVNAVKARGKSDVGAKTMLDVLVPVLESVKAGGSLEDICNTADAALEATRDMRASKGRASFLGERSRGHLDPGARSTDLLVHAVCEVLGQRS